MTHHGGLKYLFQNFRLNAMQSRWLAMLSEFEFEIKYIKSKENKVANALIKRVQIHHISTISSYRNDIE